MNNDNNLFEIINEKFDFILDKIIKYINFSKNNKPKEITDRKSSCINNEILKKENSLHLDIKEMPAAFIKEINNKIKNELKGSKYCLLNICKKCFSQLNIKINELSNIVIVYCEKCKSEPTVLSINQFLDFNQNNLQNFWCRKCKNPFKYNNKEKKKECECINEILENKKNKKNKNISIKSDSKSIPIPIFLKDCFCEQHNNFYKYYIKYSKIGLCPICFKEKSQDNYFIEKYNDENINALIKQKLAELKREKDFIYSIQQKFNECINFLQLKLEKFIELKIKKNLIKSDLINALKILKNNYTLISNVNSLQFDFGQNWNYKENDSIENRIKYFNNYFNIEADVTNIYYEKKNYIFNDNIHINPSFKIIEKIEEKQANVTDIWRLKNNEFICLSFDDGQAKIFDLKTINEHRYCKLLIKEFKPCQGINSLFVSKNNNNIFKINNNNKNEIIFLNGFEELKIYNNSNK